MNRVIYLKVETPKKMSEKIEQLNIIQIVADQDASGIKGFYIFYQEEVIEHKQLQLDIGVDQSKILADEPVKEVIKTQEEMFEEIRKRDESRVKEYDEQTSKTRELEREMWQKRMQKIQQNAAHKKDES